MTATPPIRHWLDRGLLLVVLLCCAVILSRNHADPDLWGHVRYGEDVLREGALPTTASYTYTAPEHRWINHENLSELALAAGVRFAGPSGLLMIKCLLGVGLLWLVVRQARRAGVSALATYFVLLLTATNLMYFWLLRPQLLSFLLFGLMLYVIQVSFTDWRDHWRLGTSRSPASTKPPRLNDRHPHLTRLWFLPPLFLIWANTHGAFVAGLAVLAAYLGCRSLEVIRQKGRRAWPSVSRFAAIWLASVVATFLNPYGYELHQWLLESLSAARPEILEWRRPELFSVVWIPFWILACVTLIASFASRRSRDFTQFALLGLTLWQSTAHLRHIPFFAILFAFWMPAHVYSSLQRMGICDHGSLADGLSRGRRWAFGIALLLAGVMIGFTLRGQLRQVVVKRSSYPVSAFQWMAEERVKGRLVVRFKWAQYAIAAFAPKDDSGLRVAFDGRFRTCYPQEVVDMYFDFALGDSPLFRARSPHSPPIDPERILDLGTPDLVMIDRGMPSPLRVMRERQDWTLLYQDQLVQLWGHRQVYDDPQSPDYVAPQRRSITDDPQSGFVAWPAFPRHPRVRQIANHTFTSR